MMVFDCTAVPEGLMESEMFGHVKGSFTSAVADRDGMFQLANGGSLLFDEIGELGLPLQAKLLRVIQTREFRRVGGKERLVTSHHRRDKQESCGMATGRSQGSLHRMMSFKVPPLRDAKKHSLPSTTSSKFHHTMKIHGVHPDHGGWRYHWPETSPWKFH
jgi:transcriptional regulator with GAF, ATPase, and Fis domain